MTKKDANGWQCHSCLSVGSQPGDGVASARKTAMKPALLLHSCCGPCSTAVVERLAPDYDVTVFFYNPCITDPEEYERRKLNQIAFLERFNQQQTGFHRVHFIEGVYEPEVYRRVVAGYETEPEGGARCTLCFAMRLEKAARLASAKGYDYFTTTLTVSPHKDYPTIASIGARLAEQYGVAFLDRDFKKQAGFQRSVQLAKAYGLYRQNYCGCDYARDRQL